MAFIGNQPTAVPLTSADLEDNIISTAKIQDNAVTPAKYIEPIPFRNIIINGDMSIAQRSTSVASITTSAYHTIDRFITDITTLGTWTQSQSTDVPTGQGFAKSFKMDCTTADATPVAGDLLRIRQYVEGQNLQYLKKGTANAESLTLSFWVKSNKTGTYIVELFDSDNTRQISKSYTINSASTWEYTSVTFAGDTTGTLDNDNAVSLALTFWLGAGTDFTSGTLNTSWNSNTNANRAVGQVNLADDTANEWYITGVQLEAGTTASDFEFLPYDVNLNRCLRYYENIADASGVNIGYGGSYETNYCGFHYYPYPKRTTPSLSQTTGTGYYRIYTGTSLNINGFSIVYASYNQAFLYVSITIAQNTNGFFTTNNASAKIALDAEL